MSIKIKLMDLQRNVRDLSLDIALIRDWTLTGHQEVYVVKLMSTA